MRTGMRMLWPRLVSATPVSGSPPASSPLLSALPWPGVQHEEDPLLRTILSKDWGQVLVLASNPNLEKRKYQHLFFDMIKFGFVFTALEFCDKKQSCSNSEFFLIYCEFNSFYLISCCSFDVDTRWYWSVDCSAQSWYFDILTQYLNDIYNTTKLKQC